MTCFLSSPWVTHMVLLSPWSSALSGHLIIWPNLLFSEAPHFLPSKLGSSTNSYAVIAELAWGKELAAQETLAHSPRPLWACLPVQGPVLRFPFILQGTAESTQSQGLHLQVPKQ